MYRCVYTSWCIVLGVLLPFLSNAQVNADFSASSISGCAPILVQFTDQSTGGPTNWFWDLGNGTTSTLQSPSTTYLVPGTYTVALTATNGSGSNTKTITNYITVHPTPTVNFIASDTNLTCLPKTVQFTNLSVLGVPGGGTYLWDFGDGTTSTLQNPSHTYTTVGNYNVTLAVTNSNGCSKLLTKNQYIKITTKPIAAFSTANPNSCSVPHTVNFTNGSSGATSYLWDFGNGATSTAASPSYTYTTAGSYTVRLVVSNTAGCLDTFTSTALVNVGTLSASFTKSTSTVCTNTPVVFTNTSLPGPGVSSWDFGDGTTSISTDATKSYALPGTYTIKLKVSYGANCIDSTMQTVTVTQGSNTQFTATPTSGCSVPFTTQFTNTTSGAASYLWLFGDGTTSTSVNPSKTYNALGNYTVQLVSYSANGCIDTLTMIDYINVTAPALVVIPSAASGCAPVNISFTTSAPVGVTVTSYIWNFGDGTIVSGGASASHTYPLPGTYNVTVNYSTGPGCNFTSAPVSILIGNKPTAAFTANPAPVCPNVPVNFTNSSTGPAGTTFTWLFGDGGTSSLANPTHSYSSQGTYTVSLIANSNGCKDTVQMQIVVHPPIADFYPALNCQNRKQVTFTNTSVGGNSWHWDFGDGSNSTQQHPTHTYALNGVYTVVLTVTNAASGCIATKAWTFELFDPSGTFSANDSTICKGETVTFTAQTSAYYVGFTWNFGDGSPDVFTSVPTVSHIYTSPGVYSVRLITMNAWSCFDTITKPNYVYVSSPLVNFTGTPLSGCSPLTVNFTDLSISGPFAITNRSWSFGDGATGTGSSPTTSHTYTTGVYSVQLKATDANGCIDSLTKLDYITVTKPSALFSTADTLRCPGQAVNFLNGSVGTALSYSWDFGDGFTSVAAAPSHAYSLPGIYTVRLIVTDNSGCKDTLTRNAYIKVNAINLSFNASDTFAACPPLTVSFTNTSTGAGNYSWTFGNGNTSIHASPTTVFTLPGIYTVTLKGQNSAGCMDSVTKTITILGPNGTLSYSPVNGCLPLTVQFSSTNVNTTSLIWDMNNGVTQTTTASSTTYTYTQPGVYVPKLLLSDGVSCIVPIQGLDTIKVDNVAADFSFTPVNLCNSGTVHFTDTTLFALNPITTRSWTFGDGGTSTAHNPSHTYAASGTYTVTLVIGTAFGCADTIVKTVNILPAPVVSAGSNVAICEGQTTPVQLQASGAVSYVWSPAAGLSCTTCANPLATTTATTTYTVIGTGANGCTDTSQVTITVNPLPVIISGPDPGICNGSTIQLAVAGAATYSWSPAAGLSCTTCPNPIASPATTTTYTVTGTSALGCSNTKQITVTVNGLPTLTATTSTPVICAGGAAQLLATGATSYSWTPSAGLSCTTCDNPVATPATTTTYTVAGTNGNGCTDTAMVTVTVNPLPNVSAGANQSICIGAPAQLLATGASTYQWTPATGLSCTTCPNPVANITATATYSVTGVDANGCSSSGQVTITVNALPVISVSNDQTTCAGVAVPLSVSGAQTYSWSPSTGLSCTTCPNPSASPATTTTYTVVGTNAAGCTDTAQVTVNVNPLPVVDAGPDKLVCSLGATQLQATGALNYSWTPASGLSCVNCADPIATPGAPTTYTVTGTDANGCQKSDNVTVGFHPQPVVDAGADKTICENQSIQLTATGAQNYTWSPNSWLSCTTCPNPVANPTQAITYTVTGVDANGCSDSDQVTISVIQMQPITIGPGDTICKGESAHLYATGGDEYRWYPATGLSNPNSSNPIATPEVSTKYSVIVKQGTCFTDTSFVHVIVRPQPTVYAGADQTLLAGNPVNLFADATNTQQYFWSPSEGLSCNDCQSPVALPKKTTTYTVFVSNIYGCKAQDDVTIFINCDNSLVFMANTFTPNGDGQNDRFYPQGKGISNIQRFRVYNRWGELMHDVQNIQPNNELHGWDGTYKGELLRPDVYVYILDALCDTGEPMQIKGDISLIR